MSDDLRTRIAKVLSDHDPEGAALCEYHFDLADAVIRELKLEVEDGECGYCRAQLPGCRYVTEWETEGDQ